MKNTILILEDEIIIAQGIKMHLDRNGYQCKMAHHPTDAEILLQENNFAAMIIDINLKSKITGIDFVATHNAAEIPVIYLTAYRDMETMRWAERTLPFAYITKPFNKNQLLFSLDLALKQQKKKFIHAIPEDINLDEIDLTDRELEILKLLAYSKTSSEISEQLFISTQTVATHRKNILKKTKAKSIIELVSIAVEKGWL